MMCSDLGLPFSALPRAAELSPASPAGHIFQPFLGDVFAKAEIKPCPRTDEATHVQAFSPTSILLPTRGLYVRHSELLVTSRRASDHVKIAQV